MANSKIKGALRYQLEYYIGSFLVVAAIIAAVSVFLNLIAAGAEIGGEMDIEIMGVVTNIGGLMVSLGVIIIFMLFFTGIGSVREDLRFMIQHGIGRRTVYLSTLACNLIFAVVVGLASQTLNVLAGMWDWFPVHGLTFSTDGFLIGWLFHIAVFFFAPQLGILISLVYYRLDKMGKIVVSVAGGAAILWGIPNLLLLIGAENLVNIFENPVNIVLAALLFGIAAAVGNFLLMRRVEIKA